MDAELKSKIYQNTIVFGCDPELFFSKDGRVLGADSVLPKEGIMAMEDGYSIGCNSKIIIDGVQAELNPEPSACRANLGAAIVASFEKLKNHVAGMKGVQLDFRQTIELDELDMEELSDDCKKFGCMPSRNSHKGGKLGRIAVDPTVYKYRSAGGHLHLGHNNSKPILDAFSDNVRMINFLDLIVGNTCVLLDRDPGNIERRKVYGRAGEYRTPKHGLEYRTLSNFWLRSYVLFSLVTSLARHAINIVAANYDKQFWELVDLHDVEKAINNNDYDLALSNFNKIKDLLVAITPVTTDFYAIDSNRLPAFEHFFKKGLDYWFKENPLDAWLRVGENTHTEGWETFVETTIKPDMKNA